MHTLRAAFPAKHVTRITHSVHQFFMVDGFLIKDCLADTEFALAYTGEPTALRSRQSLAKNEGWFFTQMLLQSKCSTPTSSIQTCSSGEVCHNSNVLSNSHRFNVHWHTPSGRISQSGYVAESHSAAKAIGEIVNPMRLIYTWQTDRE